MKLNNKGITLVELVMSFAILMVVVIGMLTIIVNVRNTIATRNFLKTMNEYKTDLTYDISQDLIQKGYASMTTCSTEKTECKDISFDDGTLKRLNIDLVNYLITYDSIKYQIPNAEYIEFLDSRVFDNDDITKNVYIIEEGNYIKINIPYYEIDKDDNYGIKIVHPIDL